MIEKLRDFLQTGAGKGIAIALAVIGLIIAVVSARGSFGPSEAAQMSRGRVFIDAESGKTFNHELSVGETMPVKAPSGKKTGVPAEMCYWTKDGQPKREPTYVLLNDRAIPKKEGPTFCPDCGRLVVPLNPPASPGMPPPPTKAEYKPERPER
jgi:hypothetical protein